MPFPFTLYGASRSSAGGGGAVTQEDYLDHWYMKNLSGDSANSVVEDVATNDTTRINFGAQASTNTAIITDGRTKGSLTVDTLDFNGTDSVLTQKTPSFDYACTTRNVLSFTMWMKINSTPQTFDAAFVGGVSSGGFDKGIQLFFYTGENHPTIGEQDIIIFGSGGYRGTGVSATSASLAWATTPTDGAWHHYACTLNSLGGQNLQKLYIDGSSEGNLQAASGVKNPAFSAGKQASFGVYTYGASSTYTRFLDAELSDVRFYSIVLDDDDVTAIYNGDYS
jgi:hypothetical protein